MARWILALWWLALLGLPVPAPAQAERILMDAYLVTPLPGQRGPLEQAIHEHINYRLSKGESRPWLLYTPTLGKNIGRLMLFHCCVSWEELERYHSWEEEAETTDHWMNFVEPFIQQLDHYISEVDVNSSNWEAFGKPSPYLSITELHLHAGHRERAMKDVAVLSSHVKAMDWLPRWLWSWQLGGDPVLNLIIPQDRLSDMSIHVPGFEQALGEHLGDGRKAKTLVEEWNVHFEESHFQLFRLLRTVEPGEIEE
ncbi:hypothetical protein [Ferrimonas balearica]|uniref:hypothetical protein n=1 Tax=Ferrimonas balearica TaxID=44012 RepID=UPI001C965EEE|nr:hypothetical protein [Ferrimonas balearica]MBY5979592.1 hypothetical protein [Ferrimonas balearica]